MTTSINIDRLYRRYCKVLTAYAMRFLSQEEAEDAVHDVFSFLLTHSFSDNGDAGVTSYLFRAVRNRCLDQLKHQRVMQDYERNAVEEPAEEMEQTLFNAEAYAEVFRQIDHLPDRQRQTILIAFEGKTNMEIALTMNVGIETVKSQKHKAIVRLRELLKDKGLITLFALSVFSYLRRLYTLYHWDYVQ